MRRISRCSAGALANFLSQVGDAAELAEHAGGEHHGAARPGSHRGAGKEQVRPLEFREAIGQRRFGRAAQRHRIAGESRVIGAQAVFLHNARVGRDVVAFGQNEHVAGHHLAGRDLAFPSLTQHACKIRQYLAQCADGAFGAVLLPQGEPRIDQHHHPDQHTDERAPASQGNAARNPQQQRHDVHQMGQESPDKRRRGCFRNQIGAVQGKARARLGLKQPAGGGLQAGVDLGHPQRVYRRGTHRSSRTA
jgi:hypothetical protein